jgi:hypothetical protein
MALHLSPAKSEIKMFYVKKCQIFTYSYSTIISLHSLSGGLYGENKSFVAQDIQYCVLQSRGTFLS